MFPLRTLARTSCTAEILRRLGAIRPDAAPRWGRMSAHQMVCHLTDACRMALGERVVSPATSLFRRTAVKWIALYIPVPWPSGLMTTPELDQEAGGTCPGEFGADVAELVGLIDRIAAGRANGSPWPAHPIFGGMSERAWLRWAYLHIDHHLRQFGL